MSGKSGRPPEDRLLRQREIFEAVSPLIETVGARKLTMRQAAAAAYMSLGGLCHYFPTKRSLVLHGLQPSAMERICHDFFAEHGYLEVVDPHMFLDTFIDFHVREVFFVRPSILAALELGTVEFWSGLEGAMAQGIEKFVDTLARVVPDASERDLQALARAVRRSLFAALLDRSTTPDELRAELRALIEGRPVGSREVLEGGNGDIGGQAQVGRSALGPA